MEEFQLVSFLKSLLSPKIQNLNPRTYSIDLPSGSDKRIQWLNWPKREIIGFNEETPRPGDVLVGAMESGKSAKYEVINVDPRAYPENLFFAKVRDLGYV